MVANEASGQDMGADGKTVIHYYVKGSLSYIELGKEAVIRNFRKTANSSVFDGGGLLDDSI